MPPDRVVGRFLVVFAMHPGRLFISNCTLGKMLGTAKKRYFGLTLLR
jgi:hypothetical protein